jgi:hypothetical protein
MQGGGVYPIKRLYLHSFAFRYILYKCTATFFTNVFDKGTMPSQTAACGAAAAALLHMQAIAGHCKTECSTLADGTCRVTQPPKAKLLTQAKAAHASKAG